MLKPGGVAGLVSRDCTLKHAGASEGDSGCSNRSRLESRTEECESHVGERTETSWCETRVLRNLRESVGIRENLLARLNIVWRPIVKQYREGKVKSMPVRQVK